MQYWYEFDHEIDIKENKYMLRGCYPETDLYLPFSVEDKNWFYNEIMSQDLLNYDWIFISKYLRDKNLSCPSSTTNPHLFSIKIFMNNKTHEIITDTYDCCCFITHDKYGFLDEWRELNESEINDHLALRIYYQNKELRRFSEEIKSLINSKKIEFNITEPESYPDCGYI